MGGRCNLATYVYLLKLTDTRIFATAFSATLTSAFDDSSTSESKDLFTMAMCIDDEVNVQVRYLVVYGVCVWVCARCVRCVWCCKPTQIPDVNVITPPPPTTTTATA